MNIIEDLPDLWTDEDQDRVFEIADEREREEAFLEEAERRVLEFIRQP